MRALGQRCAAAHQVPEVASQRLVYRAEQQPARVHSEIHAERAVQIHGEAEHS